jgi:allophanate hydrolase subunit 2
MRQALATVLRVGVATVQDSGRRGFQDIGVPVAGAWHRGRYELAGALLTGGTERSVPAIEILAGELILRAEVDLVLVVTGPARVQVDGRSAAVGTVVRVEGGHDFVAVPLDVGPIYLAIAGWEPPRTLGSCSTDTFSRLGGGPLAVGDALSGDHGTAPNERVGWFGRPEPGTRGPLRIVVANEALAASFLPRRWLVERTARSGVRLRSAGWVGPTESVDSFPVIPGAIQVTPDSEAIVLGPDGALTGGYPVVGVVATVDLDRVSVLAPGTSVRFTGVDPGSALRSWLEARPAYARLMAHPSDMG